MTAIAGLVHGSRVYIGGDSAGVCKDTLDLTVRADPKVFVNGPYAIGFTSSFRMGQLLQYAELPTPKAKCNLDKFMVQDFIDAVRQCFIEGGYIGGPEEGMGAGGEFLVGYKHHLFQIQADFQVGKPLNDFAACGCGDAIVLGSLYSSAGLKPEDRIQLALSAAEQFSGGVRGPFIIVHS